MKRIKDSSDREFAKLIRLAKFLPDDRKLEIFTRGNFDSLLRAYFQVETVNRLAEKDGKLTSGLRYSPIRTPLSVEKAEMAQMLVNLSVDYLKHELGQVLTDVPYFATRAKEDLDEILLMVRAIVMAVQTRTKVQPEVEKRVHSTKRKRRQSKAT